MQFKKEESKDCCYHFWVPKGNQLHKLSGKHIRIHQYVDSGNYFSDIFGWLISLNACSLAEYDVKILQKFFDGFRIAILSFS